MPPLPLIQPDEPDATGSRHFAINVLLHEDSGHHDQSEEIMVAAGNFPELRRRQQVMKSIKPRSVAPDDAEIDNMVKFIERMTKLPKAGEATP